MADRASGPDEKYHKGDKFPRRAVLRAAAGATALAGVGEAAAGGRQQCDPRACEVQWRSHVVPGNPKCEDLGFRTAVKIEPVRSGTFHFRVDGKPHFVKLWVEFRKHEPVKVSFCSDFGFKRVVVKGGPKANVYRVVEDGPDAEARTSGELSASCGKRLHAPFDTASGKKFAISHVDFCFGAKKMPRKRKKKRKQAFEKKPEKKRKKKPEKKRKKKRKKSKKKRKKKRKKREKKRRKDERKKRKKKPEKKKRGKLKKRKKKRKEKREERREERKEKREERKEKREERREERKEKREERKEKREERKEKREERKEKRKERREEREEHREERRKEYEEDD